MGKANEEWHEPLLANQSGREDWNLRPQRPERCALTGLRHSPRRPESYTLHPAPATAAGIALGPGIRSLLPCHLACVQHGSRNQCPAGVVASLKEPLARVAQW